MKFEVEKLQVGEIQFNIKHIIESFLTSIKWILLGGCVVAVLLAGVMYFKDSKDYESVVNSANAELKESDYEAVDNYLLALSRKEYIEEYAEESLILKMDYKNVYVGNVFFYVAADDAVRNGVATAIHSYIQGGMYASDIEKLGGFPKENYIRELFTVSTLTISEGNNSGVVYVIVYGATEAECQKYVDALKTVVGTYSNSLVDTIGEHQISVIEEDKVTKHIEQVYTKQKSFYQDKVNVNTEFDTKKKALTNVQINYLLENGYEIDGLMQEQVDEPSISLLFAIIGFVGGCICVMGLILLKILFGGRIQSDDELLRRLDIHCFGKIDAKKAELEQQIELIALKIDRAKIGKQVVLVSTQDSIKNNCMQILVDKLAKKGIESQFVGNVLSDVKMLETVSKYETAIMVEVVGKSKIQDIYEGAGQCANIHVKVPGYISVR